MRTRPLIATALVAGLALSLPASAAPKKKPKPITKTYTVNTPVPHPNPPSGPSCSASPDSVSEHRELFKAPAAGTLEVVASEFTGDYDIGLYGDGEKNLSQGGGVDTPSVQNGTEKEKLKYKVKKKQNLYIDVCNFIGGPSAKVTYTFTYL